MPFPSQHPTEAPLNIPGLRALCQLVAFSASKGRCVFWPWRFDGGFMAVAKGRCVFGPWRFDGGFMAAASGDRHDRRPSPSHRHWQVSLRAPCSHDWQVEVPPVRALWGAV